MRCPSPPRPASARTTITRPSTAAPTSRPPKRRSRRPARALRAHDERLPSLSINGNYGAIGTNPAQASATFSAAATLSIPIWQGGRTEATSRPPGRAHQRQSELEDLKGQVESDVRNAFLDLEAATARSSWPSAIFRSTRRRSTSPASASTPESPTTSKSSRRRSRSPQPISTRSTASSPTTSPSSAWPAPRPSPQIACSSS